MKRTTAMFKLLCLCAALLLCLPLLAACDGGNNPEGSTESTTEQPTEAPTEEVTEEITTDEVTTQESTDEATTEPPTPQLTTSLSFAELSGEIDLSAYFFDAKQCQATLTQDDAAGQVLSITSANTPVGAAAQSDPYIYFRFAQLLQDLGYEAPDTRSYPHLVLRVRDMGTSSQIFSLFGYSTKTPKGAGVTGQMDARLASTDEWQYIYFDLSSFRKNLLLFRFDITSPALADGETLCISDMMLFASAEEVREYLAPDTYPITQQTAENYVAKIMSFNVQTENGTTVPPEIRKDMLRDLIDEYMPDSIGLQEVTTKWREMMDSYVFNQSYASVGEPRTAGGEANPIYYRSDKYELIDSGTFWLSDTPDVVGSMIEGCNYARICTWVHLRDKVTGTEFVHLNTHLDHNGNNEAKVGRSIRTQQFTVILKFMQRFENIPMILTGDLNQAAVNSSGEKYAVYKTMIGEKAFKLDDGTEAYSPLSNARYDAPDNMPEGQNATQTAYYDQSNSKYNPAKEPIDYVLYTASSLTALSYKTRLYDRGSMYLSDHLPVICEIKFAPAQEAE
ncbi:MAG: endonuclease/exonuclease/phosphatase family protein [Clostridia bacterium]|nr:endonuclease/exonuclease/phosphatase family protein [Clostridia bacterium]